jgi:hypothetical protein
MRCLMWWCLIAFGAMWPLGIASGDDAAIEGVGGSIKPMDEHLSVVMESERVTIDVWPHRAVVDCVFVLHNTGKATAVRMGFPEQGWGDIDVDHPSGFTSFQTFVDGRRVHTKTEGLETQTGGPTGWKRWRVKTVKFAGGQTRSVRVQYSPGIGGMSTGERFFEYTLRTGASWKRPIGHATVITRLHAFPKHWDLTAPGTRRDGYYLWEKRDFEPAAQDDLQVFWFPGYRRVRVNGQPVTTNVQPVPSLERGVVWAAVHAIQDWLDQGLPFDSKDRTRITPKANAVEFERMARAVRLTVGSVTMETNGRRVTLPGAPYLRGGRMVVPLAPVARALGARVWFDPKTKTTHIETRGASPPAQ